MLLNKQQNIELRNPSSQHRQKMANFKGLIDQIASVKRENKYLRTFTWCLQITSLLWIWLKPSQRGLLATSKQWLKPSIFQENEPFFGLLSHAFFPLPFHLLMENFDFECTNIIIHQFVLKSRVVRIAQSGQRGPGFESRGQPYPQCFHPTLGMWTLVEGWYIGSEPAIDIMHAPAGSDTLRVW